MPVKSRDNKIYADLRTALRRKAKLNDWPCWICGKPIAWDADWKHPMSFTYDHEEAVAAGGDMRGTGRPAHRSCNSRRGAPRRTITPPTDSREW